MSYRQISFLEKMQTDFKNQDSYQLKETSNHAILDAIETLDKSTAKIAVLAYSLSKIVSKEHVLKNPLWGKAKKNMSSLLFECTKFLKKNKQHKFQKKLEKIEKMVKEVDNEIGNYVRNVWDKAKIKIASSFYAKGLSLSQASQLAEANKAELQNYIGITKIHDEEKTGYSMKQRMKTARKIFNTLGQD